MPKKLTCPLCGSKDFAKEEGRIEGMRGLSMQLVTFMICNNCKFVMQFSKGKTTFMGLGTGKQTQYWDFS
jgi:RNA polymerase subunit RPABC4/transcription elongation factor Spt4